MEKQFIKRACDSPVCDTVQIIDPGVTPLSGTCHWIVITTQKMSPDGKQIVPVQKLACRPRCGVNILNTEDIAPPPQEEQAPKAEPAVDFVA